MHLNTHCKNICHNLWWGMTFIQWSTCFLSNTLLLGKVPGSSHFWINNYIDHLRGKKIIIFLSNFFFKLILKMPMRWRTYKLQFWQLIIKINVMSLWCHFGIRNKWHQLNIQKNTWIQNVVRFSSSNWSNFHL